MISEHKGATQTFRPTKTIHQDSTVCPKCNSKDITQIETKKRNMLSISPPIKYDVTEHILHNYTCQSCKKTFENDGNLPPRGQFDGTVIKCRYLIYLICQYSFFSLAFEFSIA